MKILVVDDYEEGAYITARLLEGLGHEVELAYDGPSAIEKASSILPDIILMDINMPGMNGYEACAKMRKKPGLENTVIFAFTGMDNKQTKQQAKEAGFDDIIIKASSMGALQEKIESMQTD